MRSDNYLQMKIILLHVNVFRLLFAAMSHGATTLVSLI